MSAIEKRKQAKRKGTYVGFKKLARRLAAQKNGVRNPKAVAAAIGRKKYGAKGMGQLAAAGR